MITLKYHTDTISIEVTQDSFFCQLLDDPACKELDFTDMKLSVSVKDFFCYFQGKSYDLYNLINCMNFFQMLDKYTFLFDKLTEPYDERCYNSDISDMIMKHFGEYETMIKITKGLKLRYVGKIDATNKKITNKLLYQCKDCLEITELNASDNSCITNVNYMTSLVVLLAGADCGINDKGLKNCTTLQKLNAGRNPKITTVNHMTNLVDLCVHGDCGISDIKLKNCITLRKLNASENPKITKIEHMTNLVELDASYHSGINDDGLKKCITLQNLNASNNPNITTVNHMASLFKLDASGYQCGINDDGLKNVTTLKKLDAHNNPKITTVNHMKHLVDLDASFNCGINDEGVKNCTMLQALYACCNNNITKKMKMH